MAPFVRGKDAGTCRAGSRASRAGACRMPPPARKHHPRGGFCCRRASPFALTGPSPLSPGRFLLPSGHAVCPTGPPFAPTGPKAPSPGRFLLPPGHAVCPRWPAATIPGAAPYVPSRRKPGQMLKRERPDLDFAEKCGIFAKQRRKSYTTDGFLLF